jgi:hypothetical protein
VLGTIVYMSIQVICICTHPIMCAEGANNLTGRSLCPVLSNGASQPNCLASISYSSLLGTVHSTNEVIMVGRPNKPHVFPSSFVRPISDLLPIGAIVHEPATDSTFHSCYWFDPTTRVLLTYNDNPQDRVCRIFVFCL